MNEFYHEGVKRRSGRFRYGTGEIPFQHEPWFTWGDGSKGSGEMPSWAEFAIADKYYKQKGLTDSEIVKKLQLKSIAELREKRSISSSEIRQSNINRALSLKEHGYSTSEIGRRMGVNESTVRGWLAPKAQENSKIINNTAKMLEKQVLEKKYLDVGKGNEVALGVSQTRLKTAISKLEEQGYKISTVRIPQVGRPGQMTKLSILTKEDVPYSEIIKAVKEDKLQAVTEWSTDGGRTFDHRIKDPVNISAKRIMVRYYEDGGVNKDGTIEIRRGVDDLSLGHSRYAQVRIGVEGTHYLKGMAMYNDGNDMPHGVDIIFNTNKKRGTPLLGEGDNSVLKKQKYDPDTNNPFGAYIKANGQREYIGKDGKTHLGAVNIVNEESDWKNWSNTIASQMLAKQNLPLIKRQLDLTIKQRKDEYSDIMALNNPIVKKKLLKSFADDLDSSAEYLDAVGFSRQSWNVILPINSLKSNEIYAPNYNNGEHVCLVRYPHGGTFEIPELIVNNNNKEAKSIFRNVENGSIATIPDAVGINHKTASQLSGADFDGDTVLVIPTNSRTPIKTTSPLKSLENFETSQYKIQPGSGVKVISEHTKQVQMGVISNLITDMTIKGANTSELARATRHSMVVIDARKHELDYKQSYKDNRIEELKKVYQDRGNGKYGGSTTLLSRAKSPVYVEQRDPYNPYRIDKNTGERIWNYTGNTTTNKKGETVKRLTKVHLMNEIKDAHEISTGSKQENAYANYANQVKALANKARKVYANTKGYKYNPEAAKLYKKEVESLDLKYKNAISMAPLERQANMIAGNIVKRAVNANPSLRSSKDDYNKLNQKAIAEARARVGKQRIIIDITQNEWNAISSGAITNTRLENILKFADEKQIRQYATPKTKTLMSNAKISRAKAMLNAGCTLKEVSNALGVSISTIENAIR